MSFFKPESCFGCIPLRAGALIFLILMFIVVISSFKNNLPNIIINVVGILMVYIGMIGVFIHKSYCIRANIYYYIFQWVFNVIFTYGSFRFQKAFLIIFIGTVFNIYFIIVLNAYANQLSIEEKEEEEREKREIAAAAAAAEV